MRCAAREHSCYRALQCLLGACCTTAAQASVSLFYVTLQSRARLLPRTFSLCCVAEQTVVGGRPIVQGRVFTNVLRGPGGWRMAGPSGFVVESLYQPVGGLRLSLRGGLGVLVFGCCGWYAGGSPIRPTVPVLSLHPSARTRAGGADSRGPLLAVLKKRERGFIEAEEAWMQKGFRV